jgi:hypothetical protein
MRWHYRCKHFINNIFMNSENRNKVSFQESQEGSGSAENKGLDRDQQRAKNTKLDQQEQQNIGNQLGSDKNRVADLDDQGLLSGRDDYSGGSGDRMEDESTGEPTSR